MTSNPSSEALMLRDVVYELNEMMRDSTLWSDPLPGEALGFRRVVALLHHQMNTFGVDQSDYAEPLLDPDEWFAGRVGPPVQDRMEGQQ